MAARTIDVLSCSTHPSKKRRRSACTYHVFLSFRGADTRTSFTDFLYEALEKAGFHTFRDDKDIRKGMPIEAEIGRGIMESKMCIVVLSKGYASSEWCLDELVMIMQRKGTCRYFVLPIFYDVDPEQVSDQTHYYAEVFARHQEMFDDDRVEGWRKALRDVAKLSGMVLGERHQAPFIQDVVKMVRRELDCKLLHIPKLFGAESNIERMNSWLKDGSNDIMVAIICGIGGVGKTTIAKTVYNQNFYKFEGASFLAKVKDMSEQPNGLVCLQRQLISDISNEETIEIYNVDEGMMKIKNVICCRRVLIVIDDVDELDQFNTIIGMLDWLYKGSKVIVTTRQQNFLKLESRIFKLKVCPLDEDKALQLFSWHYSRQENSIVENVEDSKIVVQHCGGLPLALKVIGSSLSCNHDLWKIALQEPGVMDNDGKIQKILRISYESLTDDRDKSLFLDIACFFVGKNKSIIEKIVECYDFYRSFGLQKLVDQCLITIDNNKLMMHKLVRHMGREIVRQLSPENLGKRSRLWRHKDVLTVLEDNIGTSKVRGLSLTMDSAVQTNAGVVRVKTDGLSKMLNLKFLRLDYVNPGTDCRNFPESIVWLCWYGFPFKSIPCFFSLKKIVVLEMRHSNLISVWDGKKSLPHLKVLDLSYSRNLIRTPDFSEVPLLERLVLKGCISLAEVHQSIYNLKSLKEFIYFGSSRLDGLGMEPQRKGSWWSLALHKVGIRGSPNPISCSLSVMPGSLVILRLRDCNITESYIRENLSCLPSLTGLDLSGNPIQTLPESIINLPMLRFLDLENCKMLRSLPQLPEKLIIRILGCHSLERLPNIPAGIIGLNKCDKLFEVEEMMKLELISELNKEMMEIIELVDDMTNSSQKPLIMVNLKDGGSGVWLEGGDVPSWFHHQVESHSLSITVPPIPSGQKLYGLNVCFVFSWKSTAPIFVEGTFYALATISNQTKSIEWIREECILVELLNSWRGRDMEVLWLAQAKMGEYLENGDQIHVSVYFEDEGIEVERCGIHFHYITEKEDEVISRRDSVVHHSNLFKNYRCLLRGTGLVMTSYYLSRQ